MPDDEVPYFSWDRKVTAGEIRTRLAEGSGGDWNRLAAWIMREAAFPDVWQFLSPADVGQRFGDLEPYLGRRKGFWKHIISTWRELGKI